MSAVKSSRQFLKLFRSGSPGQRKALIKRAAPKHVKAFCEICHNILVENIELSRGRKNQLAKHKHSIRFLADKKISLKRKKQLLTQKGGFLPILASLIPSVLGALFQQ